ncbi:MAG: hypothetical protein NVSMB19_05870 [Vulcanimicrobiaceae bacterium]
MSGFQEHFLDKYFAYRRRYVDSVTARAPQRRSWAVASEIARLAFVIFGNVLCATIFGALTLGAFARGGGVLPGLFLVLAVVPAVFAALSLRGLAVAIGERSRR